MLVQFCIAISTIAHQHIVSTMQRSLSRAVQHSDQLLAGLRQVTPPAQRVLHVQDFGSDPVGYQQGLDLQQRLHEKRLAGDVGDTLLQLQVRASGVACSAEHAWYLCIQAS